MFFAHVGWLLTKKDPKVIEAGKKLDLSDLERDSIIMFQKRWDPWLAMFVCFALAPLTSYFFWNEDFVAHYFVEVLRYVFILHCTWLVNSAAHKWGAHPYDDSINPAENPAVAFFAGGEFYHCFCVPLFSQIHSSHYEYFELKENLTAGWVPGWSSPNRYSKDRERAT